MPFSLDCIFHSIYPQPMSLLRNDRSTLTDVQWNLLSNVVHVYDQESSSENFKSNYSTGMLVNYCSFEIHFGSQFSRVMSIQVSQ